MGPTWPFLLMDRSHGMRHTGFRRLTVVNGTPGIGASHFYYTDEPERPGYGSRSRTELTTRDFRDLGACLRHHTTD